MYTKASLLDADDIVTSVVNPDNEVEPDDGVCQVADVEDVAVKTWPLLGAVADDILIVVVEDNKPVAGILVLVKVNVWDPSVKIIVFASRMTGYNRLYAS